ncbi:serine/threonine-protein kinase [Diaminobutyricimonas sp. TR449]|uniref:serine/threonine-protein kinase n=1 Tax=Diaminobutyricimonas sp. TR449 TaxID=2708076 RepID=UPI00141F59AF|nr:serine/threonine-protein kinase [Diaminobutyricimonas sp. TR449]
MRRTASPPPDLPGFTFTRVLGSGGFSDVFLYEQQLPKRRVAVKVLLAEDLSPATRAAFVAEANVMAQLSAHPYIVTIYHAGVSGDGRPYLMMEYAPGKSLADRYKREVFGVADAIRIGVRLSSAVATAHAAGILHRDIKPANVLTNDFGWPALTDFGIASSLDDDAFPAHTTTLGGSPVDTTGGTGGQSVGMSVPWSPPEMFSDDPQPDVRSDVFSLAATLYTLLAGHSPFEMRGRSNGTLDLIGRIERGAITPLTRDDAPRSLVAVLHKGMASDPAARFQTAIDFARALQRVEMELGYQPTAIDVPNLSLMAPVSGSDTGEDDPDATRARGIASIDAQPIAVVDDDRTRARGATPIDAQPTSAAPIDERTVVRRTPTPGAAADISSEPSPQPTPVPAATEPPRRKRRPAVIITSAAAAVVLLAIVIVAIVLSPGMAPPQTRPEPSATAGSSAVIDTLAAPVLAETAASADGTQVAFTVQNPDPQDGDSFRWSATTDGTQHSVNASDETVIIVDGVAPGARTCITVVVQRSGKLSNETEGCHG